MPNWCYNDEYIYGPTKRIEELYRKLDSWIKTPHGDKYWIGNIFINASFDLDKNDISCRCWLLKWFEYFDDEELDNVARVEFSSESAWTPIYDSWDKFLKKYFPSCKYCFASEEPGNELYLKRDPLNVFSDREYIIDFIINEPKYFGKYIYLFDRLGIEEYCGGYKGYLTEGDTRAFIRSIIAPNNDLKTDDMTTEELLKKFNENVEAGLYGKDNYFGIYKFEEVGYDE